MLDEAALVDRERVLGHEHPNTLLSRTDTARAYDAVGRTEEALALFERVLDERERTLGVEHPDTNAVRDYLLRARARLQQSG